MLWPNIFFNVVQVITTRRTLCNQRLHSPYKYLPIILAVVDLMVTGDGDDRLLTTTTRTTPPVISTSRTAPPVIGTARASSPVFTASGQCARIK